MFDRFINAQLLPVLMCANLERLSYFLRVTLRNIEIQILESLFEFSNNIKAVKSYSLTRLLFYIQTCSV